MDVADFDFDLPDELIAQHPPAERGGSRLLTVPLDGAATQHGAFTDLPQSLRAGDLLVVNDTRVFPARLLGTRDPSGGQVECLLLERSGDDRWLALVHPGQKLKPGARVVFEGPGVVLHGEILDRHFHGRRTVRLWVAGGGSVDAAVDAIGHIPLPPYIRRQDDGQDRERYQTVYANARGSIAAPTAGLHFTPAILARLKEQGVETAAVTLHVGYGTFKPVRTERVEDHAVDAEQFGVSPAAAAALTRALRERRRVIAVGTTTARVLESLQVQGDTVQPAAGATDLFIRPGHQFTLVQGLVTNFHLPRSSLLMLVCALGGRERILTAYRDAVAHQYHFYSYGDAMLVL
ncbi:MAG: tRNA preQ1(34) S-adenosylmethionine ribosyltransferase-isomerase QueA [Vicinamibacterales bacterium]|nr:tRNA preQ1(34) S-adenosylmethionine ribosyltransferase-isomerase QueA [Vicinamibacterales bacterium]